MKKLTASCFLIASILVGCKSADGTSDKPSADPAQSESQKLYSLTGTVSGLNGSGLSLMSETGALLSISNNGSIAIEKQYLAGNKYSLSVHTQPSNPDQECLIMNPSGYFVDSDISNVAIVCLDVVSLSAEIQGGSLAGLQVTFNGGDAIDVVGPVAQLPSLTIGSTYKIEIATMPVGQDCDIENGTGIVVQTMPPISVLCRQWDTEQGIDTTSQTYWLFGPELPVELNDNGNAVSAWKKSTSCCDAPILIAGRMVGDSGWLKTKVIPPERIVGSLGLGLSNSLAFDQNDNGAFSWTWGDNEGGKGYVITKSVGLNEWQLDRRGAEGTRSPFLSKAVNGSNMFFWRSGTGLGEFNFIVGTNGVWTSGKKAFTLPNSGVVVENYRDFIGLAQDGDENYFAAWTTYYNSTCYIYASRYDRITETWQTPQLRYYDRSGRCIAHRPSLAVGSEGTAIITATVDDYRVLAIRYDPVSEVWLPPVYISGPQPDPIRVVLDTVSAPISVADNNGNLWSMWIKRLLYSGSGSVLEFTKFNLVTKQWDAIEVAIEFAGSNGSKPNIDNDNQGNIMLSFVDSSEWAGYVIRFNASAGQWSEKVRLSDIGEKVTVAPSLSVNSLGNAITMWAQQNRTTGIRTLVYRQFR